LNLSVSHRIFFLPHVNKLQATQATSMSVSANTTTQASAQTPTKILNEVWVEAYVKKLMRENKLTTQFEIESFMNKSISWVNFTDGGIQVLSELCSAALDKIKGETKYGKIDPRKWAKRHINHREIFITIKDQFAEDETNPIVIEAIGEDIELLYKLCLWNTKLHPELLSRPAITALIAKIDPKKKFNHEWQRIGAHLRLWDDIDNLIDMKTYEIKTYNLYDFIAFNEVAKTGYWKACLFPYMMLGYIKKSIEPFKTLYDEVEFCTAVQKIRAVDDFECGGKDCKNTVIAVCRAVRSAELRKWSAGKAFNLDLSDPEDMTPVNTPKASSESKELDLSDPDDL